MKRIFVITIIIMSCLFMACEANIPAYRNEAYRFKDDIPLSNLNDFVNVSRDYYDQITKAHFRNLCEAERLFQSAMVHR